MKKVPLKHLKQSLAAWAALAHKGETVEVTKYNRPYLRMVPVFEQGVRIGANVGKQELRPALSRSIARARILEALAEDRDED